MVSSGRAKERAKKKRAIQDRESLKRNPAFREPKRRILIVCEGKLTEPEYFNAFAREHRESVVVKIAPPKHSAPGAVVDCACSLKRSAEADAKRTGDAFDRWDEVWAVFDRDNHSHVPKAFAAAELDGVRVAFSNPCFELWALLHFQPQAAHIERDALQKRLRRYLPDYEKRLDFEELHPHYPKAIERAKELLPTAKRDVDAFTNPTTNVFDLTESIARGKRSSSDPSRPRTHK